MNQDNLQRQVEAFIKKPDFKPIKLHGLLTGLGYNNSKRKELRKVLKRMEDQNRIVRLPGGRLAAPESGRKDKPRPSVTGVISIHPQGFAFVAVEPQSQDHLPGDNDVDEVFIPVKAVSVARHGDRVLVTVEPSSRKKGLFEGKVLEVIERANVFCVGTLRRSGGSWSILPDDSRFQSSVRVRDFEKIVPKASHKVVVRLDDRMDPAQGETGVLVEDLGHADDVGVDILAIMRTHSLTSEFSKEVMDEALAFKTAVTPKDLKERRDLRKLLTLTIDPYDARDFDDALSIEILDKNITRVGIHIADNAHFVRMGGPLDQEAFARGTSAYLVDRVVPMLPEHLTNDLCSLVPHQDRLAHTVFLDLNSRGTVKQVDTCRSVIHSDQRLTYEQAQTLLDGGQVPGVSDEARDAVLALGRLTRKLRKGRMREHALAFEMPEIRCVLDDEGQVTGFTRKTPIEANHLVEECMLMANREVGALLASRFGTAIYRVHEEPTEDDFNQMAEDLRQLGIEGVPVSRETLNEIIGREMADPLRQAVTITLLKNMNRAVYSEELGEHFGLAFDTYTHFTSPIRRYPDLVAHRLLLALEKEKDSPYGANELRKICLHCSERERAAADAEQETVNVKRLDYYREKLNRGEPGPYEGTVSNIIPRGVLVELNESGQRGLIPFPKFDSDYFEVNSTGTRATGRNTGRVIQLGDPCQVLIVRVDLETRQIDFLPAEQVEKEKD
ncbi:MAG: VacB/RNase II family 3'-5' exoribonuclease [Verrucomicrobia bacterium]|nr:VacB/RNase II family 3'-5' exoribonuclease [Verrucomicrobiota bacterium]MCH8526678.1 VacB/RNase II family 3'-5' exoribonuclease [Kiritimatiellia bacterium]